MTNWENMTIGVSIVLFVIKVLTLVQRIYKVEAYQVPIVNPRWPKKKSKMAATKFSFFDIATSDRGDFPRTIEMSLLSISSFTMILSDYVLKRSGCTTLVVSCLIYIAITYRLLIKYDANHGE